MLNYQRVYHECECVDVHLTYRNWFVGGPKAESLFLAVRTSITIMLQMTIQEVVIKVPSVAGNLMLVHPAKTKME